MMKYTITNTAATQNQPIPTDKPYSFADTFCIVKEGFTALVEGSNMGNMEAIVDPKLPKINKDE